MRTNKLITECPLCRGEILDGDYDTGLTIYCLNCNYEWPAVGQKPQPIPNEIVLPNALP